MDPGGVLPGGNVLAFGARTPGSVRRAGTIGVYNFEDHPVREADNAASIRGDRHGMDADLIRTVGRDHSHGTVFDFADICVINFYDRVMLQIVSAKYSVVNSDLEHGRICMTHIPGICGKHQNRGGENAENQEEIISSEVFSVHKQTSCLHRNRGIDVSHCSGKKRPPYVRRPLEDI